MTTPPTPHDVAIRLTERYGTVADLSEADTRHQIIDTVLHDVLSWPRSSVVCEEYIAPGYADYVLLGHSHAQILFVEAKREGRTFQLPAPLLKDELSGLIKVKTLLTDAGISDAIVQVQKYCINSGCELGAITNGHQWVFFKTFERNMDWRELHGYVIGTLRYFADAYTEAVNTLGYRALTENASLAELLGSIEMKQRERFFPKSEMPEYNQEVHNNFLGSSIRPLADRYLGSLNPADPAFMDECYVSLRDYQVSVTHVTRIINDCLTPYFKGYNVQEFFDNSKGGEFGSRIASHLRERRTREVIILFGGKGAGKSTFIRKLLYHRPPQSIAEHSRIAVVDLLECPEDIEVIQRETWRQLLNELDHDGLLRAGREDLLQLFSDRFETAQKQILAGLDTAGEAYNLQLNDLIQKWLGDREYCVERLADYWKSKQRGTIVVVDNTDQFSPSVQDYCFTMAQSIATLVDGLVVISMREERFHASRLHGTLDAFQNNGFHLSSPPPDQVFRRRLLFMLRVLDDVDAARMVSPTLTDERIQEVKSLLRILAKEFKRDSHLNYFIRACSHGNMRLSLEMFREFLLSGYTRVEEMLRVGTWNLQIHQVLRPMMIPDRFFYAEALSSIPNIYQLRSDVAASHLGADPLSSFVDSIRWKRFRGILQHPCLAA